MGWLEYVTIYAPIYFSKLLKGITGVESSFSEPLYHDNSLKENLCQKGYELKWGLLV